MQNYTIDTTGKLVQSTTTATIARRLQYGENSVFVVGRKSDIAMVKGTAKRFIPNIPGEYNGKDGVDVTGISDIEVIQHDDKIWELNGKKARLGKLVIRNFPGMPDAMLNVVLGNLKSRDNVSIEVSEAVVATYDECFGGSSCMTGNDSGNMQVLQDNGVKVLRVQKDGNAARALLWTCDDNETFVDRIYPNDSPLTPAIHAWAASNGYWHRENNSYPSGSTICMKDGSDRNDFEFTLKCDVSDGIFPYLDSFHYGEANGNAECSDEHILLNFKYGDICFEGTDGTHSEQGAVCSCCGHSADREDMYSLSNGDSACSDCAYGCEDCDEYFHSDDTHNIDGRCVCDSCVENGDYAICDRSGDMHHMDDMITTDDGMVHTNYQDEYVYIAGEGVYVDSDYAVYAEDTREGHRKSDCKECSESGEWFYNWEDCGIVTYDGNWVHNDHIDGYTEAADTNEYHKIDDLVECVESGEYYHDTDSGSVTNRGFVSEDNLTDYFEFAGSYYHTDDAEDNGFVYAEDTDEYIKKCDAYVCADSGEFVAQPLFANV